MSAAEKEAEVTGLEDLAEEDLPAARVAETLLETAGQGGQEEP